MSHNSLSSYQSHRQSLGDIPMIPVTVAVYADGQMGSRDGHNIKGLCHDEDPDSDDDEGNTGLYQSKSSGREVTYVQCYASERQLSDIRSADSTGGREIFQKIVQQRTPLSQLLLIDKICQACHLGSSIPQGTRDMAQSLIIHTQHKDIVSLLRNYANSVCSVLYTAIPSSQHKRRVGWILDGKTLHVEVS